MALNLVGQRFTRLLVLRKRETKASRVLWECLCDCGELTKVSTANLRSGNTKSCKCLSKEKSAENGRKSAKKRTHCKKGHELSEDNLIITDQGERLCKVCKAARDRTWRVAHPVYVKEHRAAHYRDNKQEYVDRATAWNKSHPEETKIRGAKYKRNYPEKDRALQAKRRTAKTQAGGFYTSEEWFTLCFACEFRCLCCGENKRLEADHVIPVCHGGSSFLHNIQPLCGQCNRKKAKKHTDYRNQGETDSCQTQEYSIFQDWTQQSQRQTQQ